MGPCWVVVVGKDILGVVVVKMVCCSGSMLGRCSWYGYSWGGSCENGVF